MGGFGETLLSLRGLRCMRGSTHLEKAHAYVERLEHELNQVRRGGLEWQRCAREIDFISAFLEHEAAYPTEGIIVEDLLSFCNHRLLIVLMAQAEAHKPLLPESHRSEPLERASCERLLRTMIRHEYYAQLAVQPRRARLVAMA